MQHDGAASEPGSDESGLIKIGEFAKAAGTNLRTLRYYEEIGLLQPATRSAGGFRFYRREDLDRLRMVARLQELGLELARIRELMTPRRAEATHTERMAGLRCALTEQRGLIEARMNTLAEQHESLGRALEKLAECERCTHTPSSENNFCHPCQVDGKELPVDLSALF